MTQEQKRGHESRVAEGAGLTEGGEEAAGLGVGRTGV